MAKPTLKGFNPLFPNVHSISLLIEDHIPKFNIWSGGEVGEEVIFFGLIYRDLLLKIMFLKVRNFKKKMCLAGRRGGGLCGSD